MSIYYTNLINPNVSSSGTQGDVLNPMVANLDAGGFNIVNLAQPADPNDAVTLSYLESSIPENILTNPMTTNLQMGSNAIIFDNGVNNTNSLNVSSGGVLRYNTSFIQMQNSYINMGGNVLSNCGTMSFQPQYQGYTLDTDSTGQYLTWGGANIVTTGTDINMNDHSVTNLSSIVFDSGNDAISLTNSNNNLVKNGNVVILDENNFSTYIQTEAFDMTATDTLIMNGYPIISTESLQFEGAQILKKSDNNPTLSYGNKDIIVKPTINSNVKNFTMITQNTSTSNMMQLGTFTFSNASYFDNEIELKLEIQVSDNYTMNMESLQMTCTIIDNATLNTKPDFQMIVFSPQSFYYNPETNIISLDYILKSDLDGIIDLTQAWLNNVGAIQPIASFNMVFRMQGTETDGSPSYVSPSSTISLTQIEYTPYDPIFPTVNLDEDKNIIIPNTYIDTNNDNGQIIVPIRKKVIDGLLLNSSGSYSQVIGTLVGVRTDGNTLVSGKFISSLLCVKFGCVITNANNNIPAIVQGSQILQNILNYGNQPCNIEYNIVENNSIYTLEIVLTTSNIATTTPQYYSMTMKMLSCSVDVSGNVSI